MPANNLNEILQNYNNNAEIAIKALLEDVNIKFFYIGGLLHHLKENNRHLIDGYEATHRGFIEYVTDRFDIGGSTCDLLIRVFNVLTDAGIDADDLVGTNLSKIRLVVMLPIPELQQNRDHWLDLARKMSAAKLDAQVRERLQELEPQKKAGRPTKRSNKCNGIAAGRHVGRGQYRAILEENERLRAENAKLRNEEDLVTDQAAEPAPQSDIDQLKEKIAVLENDKKALMGEYERQHKLILELEQQIPAIAQNQDPGEYMILNFTAEQKELFNRVVKHAKRLRQNIKDDITAFWHVFTIYDELLIQPRTKPTKERSLKRLAGILAYAVDDNDYQTSDIEIAEAMYEDTNRGVHERYGGFWHSKTRDTL